MFRERNNNYESINTAIAYNGYTMKLKATHHVAIFTQKFAALETFLHPDAWIPDHPTLGRCDNCLYRHGRHHD